MTPEQHQEIVRLLTELVENRRDSLALQREALNTQLEAVKANAENVAYSKRLATRYTRLYVTLTTIAMIVIVGAVFVGVMLKLIG
jgi:tetrahydromethanopterin S-methyltransferase subunit F